MHDYFGINLADRKTYRVIQNKCIGDDTKAAARQSLNCIKNKKKYISKTIFNTADGILTSCNVAGGSGMTCH